MKIKNLLLLLLALGIVFFSACNKDDDDPQPEINESEVLVKYLESTSSPLGKDYVNSDMPSIMSATEVKTLNETGQVYIMDVRSATDFAAGHIANAVNVEIKDALTHIKSVNLSSYTKVAVVCYSGQSAAFVASVLRIMGYDKVFSMKWGMCSWNADFASRWNNTIASGNAYAAQFVTTATAKGAKGDLPELNTGKTEGQAILEARAATILTEGWTPASVSAATVFGGLTGYYIVNYWPANHYDNPGHIPGAMQYTPKESIKLGVDLKTLPTDKPVVVYCYTGQTSAFMSAYLRLLGYDAKSLLFGANGMIYDNMMAAGLTIWKADQIMGYDYVTSK